MRCAFTLTAVNLPFYRWVKGSCPPWGIPLCVCVWFFQVEKSSGNFDRYAKKNGRITHDSSRGTFYGLIRAQSGSTYHKKVNLRVVHVRCLSWRQILLATGLIYFKNYKRATTQQDFERFCERVITKCKSTLRHLGVFFTCVYIGGQELFLKEVIEINFVNAYFGWRGAFRSAFCHCNIDRFIVS